MLPLDKLESLHILDHNIIKGWYTFKVFDGMYTKWFSHNQLKHLRNYHDYLSKNNISGAGTRQLKPQKVLSWRRPMNENVAEIDILIQWEFEYSTWESYTSYSQNPVVIKYFDDNNINMMISNVYPSIISYSYPPIINGEPISASLTSSKRDELSHGYCRSDISSKYVRNIIYSFSKNGMFILYIHIYIDISLHSKNRLE